MTKQAGAGCDGGGPHADSSVRKILPLPGQSCMILCWDCWHTEIQWRRERNAHVAPAFRFSTPDWGDLKVYLGGPESPASPASPASVS